MPVALEIKINQKEFLRALEGQAAQMPFAMSYALNLAGKQAKTEATRAIPRYLDKPTPFTKGSKGAKPVFLIPATKQKLSVTVMISDLQWKYLRFQVEGGTRRPARKQIIVPVAARKNAYGNMPRTDSGIVLEWLTAARSGPRSVFFGKPAGRPGAKEGVWRRDPAKGRGKSRTGDRLTLLAAFRPFARYRKHRFPFHLLVNQSVKDNWHVHADAAIRRALKTAR
jgi:hypothetical protein